MKTIFTALMAVLLAAALAGPANARRTQGTASREAVSPQDFIQKVADANKFEIQSSQLALQKSHNDAIRKFAQRMIDDHTKLGEQFKQLLEQSNMPQPGAETGKEQQAGLDRLEKLNGAAFDAAYIRAQKIAHEQLMRFAEGYSRKGSDQALKQFAREAVPQLKEHLRLAEELRGPRNLSARR